MIISGGGISMGGGPFLMGDLSVSPTYSFSSIPTSINEGSTGTFNVTTTNIANATTLYWTIATNSSDFGTTSGSFTITSNTGSFSVTPTADATTEGAETFTVAVRTSSISGTVVATSNSVTINDTSISHTIQYLIVAGGAAGAANGGNYTVGGGGAGGLIWANNWVNPAGAYTVTVGGGGTGVSGNAGRQGASGTSSSITGTGISRVTTSGTGGAYGTGGAQGSADSVAGYDGYYANSGGGGGAGGAATDKNGGPARLISELNGITGYNNTGYFAGGGAGYNGTWGTTTGGGGDTWVDSSSGAAINTGSGGAPAAYNASTTNPGKGGSGIVVIRYPDSNPAASAYVGATYTVTGGYRYYIFNTSGSITF